MFAKQNNFSSSVGEQSVLFAQLLFYGAGIGRLRALVAPLCAAWRPRGAGRGGARRL
jgi:hypothetical protein